VGGIPLALTPSQQASLMKDFIKKAKPGVTSQQLDQVEQKIVTSTPVTKSVSSQPIVTSQVSSVPPQPGDSSFVGPVIIEPTPSQPGDPSFVGPVQPEPISPTSVQQQQTIQQLKRYVAYRDARNEYFVSKQIPTWYRQDIIIPKEIKFIGYEKEYLRYGYESSIGLVKLDSMVFNKKLEEHFERLTLSKKFEYNLRFGDLGKVPVVDWKYWEGGKEYIAGLPSVKRNELIDKYLAEHPGTVDTWSQIKTGFDVAMTHSPMLGIPIFVASLFGIKESEKALRKVETPIGIKQVAWEKIQYTPTEIGQQQYDRLNVFQRSIYSAQHNLISATAWPVTLAQTGIKYVTGTGDITDPLGRIQSGKTLVLPDVGKALQESKMGGPSGIISVGVSEGIGAWTGEGSDEWAKAQKYPVETFFATSGEILGIYAGGKGLHLVKTGLGRTFSPVVRSIESKLGIPSLSAYRPTNLLRKAWWKGKEKLGRAKFIPEEQVWDPSVLAGKTKFAELPGAGKQLKLFRSTVTSEGEIVGIHATGQKLGFVTIVRGGTSETPGLSISAFGRGSPHFLRVSGGYLGDPLATRLSLFPKFYRPTAPLFTLKGVSRLPKNIRHSFGRASSYLKGLKRGPYAHIAPKVEMGGPEIEAIISKGTLGVRTSSFYYTSFKGVVVPLPTYKLLGSGMSKGAAGFSARVPSNVKSFFSMSYQSTPGIPLFSPGYFVSRLGSYPSSIVSSSYPTSINVPSYPSKPSSYTKSNIPSSLKSVMQSSSISSLKKSYGSSGRSTLSYPSYPSKPSVPSYPSKPSSPSYDMVPAYHSPPPPVFDSSSVGKRRRKKMDSLGVGYRFREWKTLTMKEFLGGKY